MTTDAQIESEIVAKGKTAPRVTPKQIDALLARVEYKFEYHHTSTFCHAFLDGEFYLATGHSACVSLANYDKEIGDRIAVSDAAAKAVKQLWLLEGYVLRTKLAEPVDDDFPLGKACDLSGEGTCESCQ